MPVLDDAIDLAVTDDDHDQLQSQLGEMADTDVAHTEQAVHAAAAAGKLFPGFTKDDMERLHGAVEAEQAKRATATGQHAPAPTPLQWPASGALRTGLPDAQAARLPGHLTTIRDRGTKSLRNVDPNVGGGRDRDQIPHEDFVFPEDAPDGGFPITTKGDVSDAVSSWGRYQGKRSFADFKSRLTAIATRKGWTSALPEAWTENHSEVEQLRSLTPIGVVSLNAGASAQSWIQVAKTGEFVSSRYGEFSITKANLEQMLRNFKTKMPQPPTKLPVDYDHLSMDPQRPGDGKAAGWFVDLELRDNGGELWGLVEWTPDAADAISKKEYQFVSPSFARNYTDKQGKKIGTTLLAAAITNHPFLEGMAPLTLCADGDLAIQLTSASARSVHTNRLVKPGDPEMAKKTFSMKDTKGNPVEVDQDELDNSDYVKSMKSDHAAALKKAKDDAVDAAKKNLTADSAEIVSLREKVSTQGDELVQLRAQRKTDQRAYHLRDAQARFDALVARGYAKPAEKDRALKLAARDLDAFGFADEKSPWDLFEDWCKDHNTKVVALNTEHGSGEGDDANKDAVDVLMALVSDKQKTDPKLTFDQAWPIVCREHPEEYEAYRKAVAVRV